MAAFIVPHSLLCSEIAKRTSDLKEGSHRLFHHQTHDGKSYKVLAVLNVDIKSDEHKNELELCDYRHFQLRTLVFKTLQEIKGLECDTLQFSTAFSKEDQVIIAETLVLTAFDYKAKEFKKYPKLLGIPEEVRTRCEAQNWARTMSGMPANLCTPSTYCEHATQWVKDWNLSDTIEYEIRDEKWLEEQSMGNFLSVAKGSLKSMPPRVLEMHVNKGASEHPKAVFVGKGVTFDTGGVSLKTPENINFMKLDMGGAAIITAANVAAAKLGVKGWYVVLCGLTENVIGSEATKPGDVVVSRSGQEVEVTNTDAEGRMVMSDLLHYGATVYKPENIIDVATLTSANLMAFGGHCVGIYSNSGKLVKLIKESAKDAGERLWRLPVLDAYLKKMQKTNCADLVNCSSRPGGAQQAAAFLSQFIDGHKNWIHIDTAGTEVNDMCGNLPYMAGGVNTARPTRSLINFIQRLDSE